MSSDIKESLYAEIELLSFLLTKMGGIKRFPLELEKSFQHDYLQQTLHGSKLTLVLGFILFAGGSSFILMFFPHWKLPFSISILMVSPVLLILLGLSYTKLFFYWQQLIVLTYAITILIGLSTIGALAPPPMKDLVYQGMILPALFVITLTNIQFRYSIFIMLTVIIAFNISYKFNEVSTSTDEYRFFVNNYLLIGASSLCVIASYVHESSIRTQFLLRKLSIVKSQLLEHFTHYDALTNIANRRYFDEVLDKEWRRAQREQYPIGLIFLDFDFFKEYNDSYGHIAGDKALYALAQTLRICARRPGDFAARYGGDEFTVILPNTDVASTLQIAEKIQLAIHKRNINHNGLSTSNSVTVTMGLSALTPTVDTLPTLLIKQADAALNSGKKIKRGKVYTYNHNLTTF